MYKPNLVSITRDKTCTKNVVLRFPLWDMHLNFLKYMQFDSACQIRMRNCTECLCLCDSLQKLHLHHVVP